MEMTEWVLVVVAILTLLYLFTTWEHSYWKKRGVLFERPQMIFGNYKDVIMMKSGKSQVVEKIYKKFPGHSFVGFFQFRKPSLLLRDPELIKAVLVKDFNSFHANSFKVDEKLDPLVARNPSFQSGDSWKRKRSVLTPAFTAGRIKPMFPLIVNVCQDFQLYLQAEAARAGPDGIEAKNACTRFTTDVVALCAFGIHGNSFKENQAELLKMGQRILKPDTWKQFVFIVNLFFPGLTSMFHIRIMEVEVANFFRRIVKEVVTVREQQRIVKNDFLQLLLTLKQQGRLEEETGDPSIIHGEYTDEDITAHALAFFADGFETSSVALSFTLYELAVNQEAQVRLRAEVDSVLEKHGGELSYEAVQDMPYLEMVLQESLRMHPPAMTLDKLCTRPYKLSLPSGGFYTVEVGTHVVIPINAVQHDPEYFPEPDVFDPERFSEENRSCINRSAFLPFSSGPRQCLGMRFAQAQIKVGVAFVVSKFDIRTTSKTPIPVEQDPTYFLAGAKGGLWLNFLRRM